MKASASQAMDKEGLSHNLLGQRLGRKGRDTRERILAAAERLLAGSPDTAISLSAVAREASLGMTTLYLYFGDLVELLLAVLDNIMATAEESYTAQLRERWPDEELGQRSLAFVEAYHAFWVRHSRILHLRNAYAYDPRMHAHRQGAAMPLLDLLTIQMDGDPADITSPVRFMATVLWTGVERVATVMTDVAIAGTAPTDPMLRARGSLRAEARLLHLGLADGRATARTGAAY
jgi:AcrR family transcriptional regulator